MFKLLEYRIQTLSNIIKIENHLYFYMVSYFIFPCIQNYSEFRIIIQNSELFRIMLKTLYLAQTSQQQFSPWQCLGSYQCLEAVRTRDSVKLHLGAPTPHLEHSCVPPNFDDDVPFLKATLVQSGAGGTGPSVTNRQNIPQISNNETNFTGKDRNQPRTPLMPITRR